MDRRQQKSRQAIFSAFTHLLEQKHFNHITVQEIIDEANVGRTTFYSHFETKDILLKEMCSDMFAHIFSHELHSEASHDFSASSQGLGEKLTHLLYHLKDNRSNLRGLLTGDSSELFLQYFKEVLAQVFKSYPDCLTIGIPPELALNHVVSSFAEAVRWWMQAGCSLTPEELASYYLLLIAYPS
ncbi:MAG: TetR/AcrR family transcriptional regulator [Oscillospiraceae bacterium]|nr:TetR/AcrR family transcriptional regulator [Oscillospiraceae bacterium]